MVQRRTLLVGSIPGNTAREAMTEAMREVGPRLRYLPDGETGTRDRWVVGIINSFRDNPDMVVRREGDWSNYKQQLNFKVRRGRPFTGDSLNLGIQQAFEENRALFDELRAGRDDLSFQIGIPGDFDLAMFTLGLPGALRHRKGFTSATVREITAVHKAAGDDVLFQLELPAEMVFVAMTPGLGRKVVARRMAKLVRGLVSRAPSDARFGVHLCLGDLGHKALGSMRDARPLVAMANAVTAAWPDGVRLEYVHGPLAAGDQPPVLDPGFYRPLADLRLPETTRFVAGFLHEGRSIDEARQILGVVESAYGGTVDVAAACGLGRRGHDNALATMRQAAALCADAG